MSARIITCGQLWSLAGIPALEHDPERQDFHGGVCYCHDDDLRSWADAPEDRRPCRDAHLISSSSVPGILIKACWRCYDKMSNPGAVLRIVADALQGSQGAAA